MLSLFDLLALLFTVTALFAWINHRMIRLPHNIGLLVMGVVSSLLLIGVEFMLPNTQVYGALIRAIGQIDFYDAVMNGMLAFLLFAGALHVNFERMRSRAWVIGSMATIGVFISTIVIGTGFWLLAQLFGHQISYGWCLVFGALISPTDPVAVLSTLKQVNVPKTLETDMAGESLFNDGVGVVLFTILVAGAVSAADPDTAFNIVHIGELLVVEAFGGAALGLLTGYVAYSAMRLIDEYAIEVLISVALVFGTYSLAQKLHISGPIAVVVAGVLIGYRGVANAMSETTRQHLFSFWTLVDEMLNSLLFLLIGLEVLVIGFDPSYAGISLAVLPLIVLARFIAVSGPVVMLSRWHHFIQGTIPMLTWGGVRGGISIALALSLPAVAERSLILAATYAVVLFTIIIQGLTLALLARRVIPETAQQPAPDGGRH